MRMKFDSPNQLTIVTAMFRSWEASADDSALPWYENSEAELFTMYETSRNMAMALAVEIRNIQASVDAGTLGASDTYVTNDLPMTIDQYMRFVADTTASAIQKVTMDGDSPAAEVYQALQRLTDGDAINAILREQFEVLVDHDSHDAAVTTSAMVAKMFEFQPTTSVRSIRSLSRDPAYSERYAELTRRNMQAAEDFDEWVQHSFDEDVPKSSSDVTFEF